MQAPMFLFLVTVSLGFLLVSQGASTSEKQTISTLVTRNQCQYEKEMMSIIEDMNVVHKIGYFERLVRWLFPPVREPFGNTLKRICEDRLKLQLYLHDKLPEWKTNCPEYLEYDVKFLKFNALQISYDIMCDNLNKTLDFIKNGGVTCNNGVADDISACYESSEKEVKISPDSSRKLRACEGIRVSRNCYQCARKAFNKKCGETISTELPHRMIHQFPELEFCEGITNVNVFSSLSINIQTNLDFLHVSPIEEKQDISTSKSNWIHGRCTYENRSDVYSKFIRDIPNEETDAMGDLRKILKPLIEKHYPSRGMRIQFEEALREFCNESQKKLFNNTLELYGDMPVCFQYDREILAQVVRSLSYGYECRNQGKVVGSLINIGVRCFHSVVPKLRECTLLANEKYNKIPPGSSDVDIACMNQQIFRQHYECSSQAYIKQCQPTGGLTEYIKSELDSVWNCEDVSSYEILS